MADWDARAQKVKDNFPNLQATTETFKSHTDNASKKGSITAKSNSLTIMVPALSTTAILLAGTTSGGTVTGLEELKNQSNEVNIYPNPAFDKLFVGMDSKGPVEITVYDQWGRKIQSAQRLSDGTTPLPVDISTINNGFYLLSVKRASGTSLGKFVIAR